MDSSKYGKLIIPFNKFSRLRIKLINPLISVTDEEKKKAKQDAASLAKGMQLNVVRLCYQCYLTDNDNSIKTVLESVVSDPIYDSSKLFPLLFTHHLYSILLLGR